MEGKFTIIVPAAEEGLTLALPVEPFHLDY
jgi:hypothetical protein